MKWNIADFEHLPVDYKVQCLLPVKDMRIAFDTIMCQLKCNKGWILHLRQYGTGFAMFYVCDVPAAVWSKKYRELHIGATIILRMHNTAWNSSNPWYSAGTSAISM